MNHGSEHDAFSAGESYEHYMGRWSREIARRFVASLDAPAGLDWLDVGCGTGALSATVLEHCAPRSVLGVDPSEAFVEHARNETADPRARFEVGGAENLPAADGAFDVVTSALAYNFFPDRARGLGEMRRVARPGAMLCFYVWDYPGGGMGFIDAFWKAAVSLDARAEALVEGARFPFCTREGLHAEALDAGLSGVTVEAIETITAFDGFDAFWRPFTLGAGPAPGYAMSLAEPARAALARRLREMVGGAGRIELPARAWAVKATVPHPR